MSFKKPFKIEEIDLDKIKFTDIKSNSKKTIVYIKYDNGVQLSNLVFQTPSLYNINKPISVSYTHLTLPTNREV